MAAIPTPSSLRRQAPLLLSLAAIAVAALSSRGLVITMYLQDTFVALDAAWRMATGQTPHIDFHSPIGQAFFWPLGMAAFLKFGGSTILFANLIVAAILSALAALTLTGRMSPAIYAVAGPIILVTAVAPRDMDWAFDQYSHLALYNRWGWALIMLIALIVTIPRLRNEKPQIDGVATGLALALLYYLKVTFFAGAVALVLMALFLRTAPIRLGAMAVGTALLCAVTVETVWGNNLQYLADVKMAALAHAEQAGSRHRLMQFRLSMAIGVVYGLACLALLWSARASSSPIRLLRERWRPLAMAAAMITVGSAIGSQNHPEVELTLHGAALLLVLQTARRLVPNLVRSRRLAMSAIALGIGTLPLLDSASIIAHAAETHSSAVCSLPATSETSMSELFVTEDVLAGGSPDAAAIRSGLRLFLPRERAIGHGCSVSVSQFTSTEPRSVLAVEAQHLTSGLALLQGMGAPKGAIFTLNFSNPFPAALRLPAPKGALIWWDYRRNFSENAYPSLDPIIASSEILLQPKRGPWRAADPTEGDALWTIYGSKIAAQANPVAENPYWTVWFLTQ